MSAIVKTGQMEFTQEQIGLVKRTLCAGASDDELALFLGQCRRTGLDPFAKQIHAVKRWDSRQRREVMAIQVGIDGFRLIAERTGEADGQDGPHWCGEDGIWRDVWLSKDPPAAAKVVVYRKGQSRGYTGIATFAEYAQRNKEGQLSGLWAKMPATMLAKCSEGLALRKAFPAELSGLYSPEEMDQATTPDETRRTTQKPKQLPPAKEEELSAEEAQALITEMLCKQCEAARAAFRAAKDKAELFLAWTDLPPEIKAEVAADKDNRKAELSAEDEQRADPQKTTVPSAGPTGTTGATATNSPSASPSTAPATDPPVHPDDDGIGEPPPGALFDGGVPSGKRGKGKAVAGTDALKR